MNIPPPTSSATSFAALDSLPIDPVGRAIMERVLQSAMHEVAAKAIVRELLRGVGLADALRQVRRMPRPMPRIEALVLEKLEAVALHAIALPLGES